MAAMAPISIKQDPLSTYKNERPLPFCPGCGHALILNHLDKALTRLQIPPTQTVIVTDIGCVGLSDQYFATNAFHGLHGRSIAYATGIKLANPDLHVIVLMGDGGAGIGGAHLINAARRNIGLTVLVFNNFNFGMTGGEHSVTTPHGAITATTRHGNPEYPLDICATVGEMVRVLSFAARPLTGICLNVLLKQSNMKVLPCSTFGNFAQRILRQITTSAEKKCWVWSKPWD